MEKSPPGIHTIPRGAGPGGAVVFSTVATNLLGMAGAAITSGLAAGSGTVVRGQCFASSAPNKAAATTATAATSPLSLDSVIPGP